MKNLDLYTASQRDAILHDKGNLLVSASAGSGKTMVVIQRILRLITESNVSVDRILAVTFTNAAASEMKEKLKTEIIKLLSEKNDAFLKDQLEKINTASISTIHSFCYDLIKKYFYEVGLDASVKLIDEKEGDKLSGEAMSNLFDRLYEEGGNEFFDALSFFTKKRKDKSLREYILKLYEFADSEGDFLEVYNATKNTHLNVYNLLKERVYNRCLFELLEIEKHLDIIIDSFIEDKKRKDFAIELKCAISKLKDIKEPNDFIKEYSLMTFKSPSNKVVPP